VARGFERRTPQGLSYAGLDEKSFGRGHHYVSVLHAPGKPPRGCGPRRPRGNGRPSWRWRWTCGNPTWGPRARPYPRR
jgi:hypothetical protein